MTATELTAFVEPSGMPRARAVRTPAGVRVFTPNAARAAQEAIRQAWDTAGRHRFDDSAALDVGIELYLARPRGHFTSKGALSAAGVRSPRPTRKPDLDNAAKLILDALSGLLFRDDAQVVDLAVSKRWAAPGEPSRVVLRVDAA